MEADFAVELGPGDEALEFPWSDPDGKLHYYDLKRHPELLLEVDESRQFPELGEFLVAVNSPESQFESAKCDAWFTADLQPEDEVFEAPGKFGSYVDLIFSDDRRYSFPEHEKFAQQLTKLLKRAPEIPAMAECIIRRCYFHPDAEGFYFTLYLFGYGDDKNECRQQWATALKLVDSALAALRGVQSR